MKQIQDQLFFKKKIKVCKLVNNSNKLKWKIMFKKVYVLTNTSHYSYCVPIEMKMNEEKEN
jgi:hypothetical protein